VEHGVEVVAFIEAGTRGGSGVRSDDLFGSSSFIGIAGKLEFVLFERSGTSPDILEKIVLKDHLPSLPRCCSVTLISLLSTTIASSFKKTFHDN
jgi:hypothetical protein